MFKDHLNPRKARIFRITHLDNVPWILDHGCHCKNAKVTDPNFVAIGNQNLIDRRSRHPVPHPPHGFLSDYIPFYFTPFSPMFYNIKTGWNGIRQRLNDEIVILVSSLHKLIAQKIRFIFTDRHAVLAATQYFSSIDNLDQIDWDILQNRDFKRDLEDPGKVERYEAEVLVHQQLPVDGLIGIICYNDMVIANLRGMMKSRGLDIQLASRPHWYF